MYSVIKRSIDILISLISLILFAPFLLLIALAIKIDSQGPVFYKQTRVGKDGHIFKGFSFRTMYISDDFISHQDYVKKLIEGELGPEKGWPNFKLANDPRVTIVGRFLRATYLNELPQYINVLIGDMSIVGPRAAIPYEIDYYEPWMRQRLTVKPGLTGLWQINGIFKPESFEEMVRMDIEYINRQSLLFDLKIMIQTLMVAFKLKGAI